MDKIDKSLAKIPLKQRRAIAEVYEQVLTGQIAGLSIKKLKGSHDIFRVRVGEYRIIYRTVKSQNVVVSISRRNEKTYRDLI